MTRDKFRNQGTLLLRKYRLDWLEPEANIGKVVTCIEVPQLPRIKIESFNSNVYFIDQKTRDLGVECDSDGNGGRNRHPEMGYKGL